MIKNYKFTKYYYIHNFLIKRKFNKLAEFIYKNFVFYRYKKND